MNPSFIHDVRRNYLSPQELRAELDKFASNWYYLESRLQAHDISFITYGIELVQQQRYVRGDHGKPELFTALRMAVTRDVSRLRELVTVPGSLHAWVCGVQKKPASIPSPKLPSV